MRINKILILTIAVLLGGSIPGASQGGKTSLPVIQHKFVVIAHRGEHEGFPENTLASTKAAIDIGADFVEMDLRTTKDSVLVLMHDATVDRTTNGKGRLSNLSFEASQQLQVRSPKENVFSSEKIPRFDSVLAICRGKINVYLDFKDADAASAYAVLVKFGMDKHTVVYINTPAQFKAWQRAAPEMPLMLSLPDSIRTPGSLSAFLQTTSCAVLDGDWTEYTQELVKAAAKNHTPVWPDIQSAEESQHWLEAIRLGVTGLQTDHPAALILLLRQMGIR